MAIAIITRSFKKCGLVLRVIDIGRASSASAWRSEFSPSRK
jgi:hypothetical protein